MLRLVSLVSLTIAFLSSGVALAQQFPLQEVERSPFSEAFFEIYSQERQEGNEPSLSGYLDGKSHDTPPGKLLICFRDLVGDPLNKYNGNEPNRSSCTGWASLGWGLPIRKEEGMTLSYIRHGDRRYLHNVVLYGATHEDFQRWTEGARLAQKNYEETFEISRRQVTSAVARAEAEARARKEKLDQLRGKPIMVYPR